MSPSPNRAASRGPQSRPRSVAPIKIPHGACIETTFATASAAVSGVYELSTRILDRYHLVGAETREQSRVTRDASVESHRDKAPPSRDASSSPRDSSSSVPRVMRPSRSVSQIIHTSRSRLLARRVRRDLTRDRERAI